MQIKRTRKDIWLNLLHWLKICLVPRCCFYWIFSCFHRVESLQGNPQSSPLSGNFWCWAVMWQQPWVSFGSFVILAFSTSCVQVILVLDVFSLYVQNVWQGFEQHCSAHSPQAIPPSCPLTGREDQQAGKRTAGQLILIGTALHFFFFSWPEIAKDSQYFSLWHLQRDWLNFGISYTNIFFNRFTYEQVNYSALCCVCATTAA